MDVLTCHNCRYSIPMMPCYDDNNAYCHAYCCNVDPNCHHMNLDFHYSFHRADKLSPGLLSDCNDGVYHWCAHITLSSTCTRIKVPQIVVDSIIAIKCFRARFRIIQNGYKPSRTFVLVIRFSFLFLGFETFMVFFFRGGRREKKISCDKILLRNKKMFACSNFLRDSLSFDFIF